MIDPHGHYMSPPLNTLNAGFPQAGHSTREPTTTEGLSFPPKHNLSFVKLAQSLEASGDEGPPHPVVRRSRRSRPVATGCGPELLAGLFGFRYHGRFLGQKGNLQRGLGLGEVEHRLPWVHVPNRLWWWVFVENAECWLIKA